jgi:hypothetical protein
LIECNTVIYTSTIGPFSQNTDIGVVTVSSATSLAITIKGKILNCTGNVVNNGYAIVDYLWPRYVSANNSGDFTLVIFSCVAPLPNADITVVDNATQQQATSNVTITSPVTNTGNLTACGTSSAQYINYAMDGNPYVVASPADTLNGMTGTQGTTSNTNIYGYHNGQYVGFSFTSNMIAPGTYSLNQLGGGGLFGGAAIVPSNAIITSFPAVVGGFYEGSFSGSFKDSTNTSVTHTINGNFRVRRN